MWYRARAKKAAHSGAFFQLNSFLFQWQFLSRLLFFVRICSQHFRLVRTEIQKFVWEFNLRIVHLGSMCISRIDFMVKYTSNQLAKCTWCIIMIYSTHHHDLFSPLYFHILPHCVKLHFFTVDLFIWFHRWSALNFTINCSTQQQKEPSRKLFFASERKTFSSFHFKRVSSSWYLSSQ